MPRVVFAGVTALAAMAEVLDSMRRSGLPRERWLQQGTVLTDTARLPACEVNKEQGGV